MKSLVVFLVLSIYAVAQAPANPVAIENNKSGNPLSTNFSWDAVPNATYEVYRAPAYLFDSPCSSGQGAWNQIAAVSITNFQDFPPQDPVTGWAGGWCYGVKAVVNGVESPMAIVPHSVILGQKWYFVTQDYDANCLTALGNPNPDKASNFELHRVRAGQDQIMPQTFATNLDRWAGYMDVEPGDVFYGLYTRPKSGKKFKFPNLFNGYGVDGEAGDAIWGAWKYAYFKTSDDTTCQEWNQNYLEHTTNGN